MPGERRSDTAGERDSLLSHDPPTDLESAEDEGSFVERPKSDDSRLEVPWRKNLVLLLGTSVACGGLTWLTRSIIGVFLVNSDSAVLLALFRQIGSEFDEMSSASWIVNSSTIGLIVTQPLVLRLVIHCYDKAHDS